MKVVWKYALSVTDTQVVSVPKDAEILTVQTQQDIPCLWVLCDPDQKERKDIKIMICGTGHATKLDDVYYRYLSTFQLHEGRFIGHVFITE